MINQKSSEQTGLYQVLKLRPKWCQFIIDELPLLLLELCCICCFVVMNSLLGRLSLFFGLCLLAFLIYKAVYIRSIYFYITPEQLIFQQGLFNVTTEYMELYRVIDYQQKRSFLEQLFGLKTVVIISGDRSLPVLKIFGINTNVEIIAEIRERVEFNKKRRGVYEITNRY